MPAVKLSDIPISLYPIVDRVVSALSVLCEGGISWDGGAKAQKRDALALRLDELVKHRGKLICHLYSDHLVPTRTIKHFAQLENINHIIRSAGIVSRQKRGLKSEGAIDISVAALSSINNLSQAAREIVNVKIAMGRLQASKEMVASKVYDDFDSDLFNLVTVHKVRVSTLAALAGVSGKSVSRRFAKARRLVERQDKINGF